MLFTFDFSTSNNFIKKSTSQNQAGAQVKALALLTSTLVLEDSIHDARGEKHSSIYPATNPETYSNDLT